ncbi:hypothetical protein DFJ58DRAFT_744998 [Suillus subalutaceus]|uniref:uncharacterized protein n=1 Tax=Suillus subalutaceus TaxID=48586 RepID=UPI001B878C20|nr:uncharacterized protein DFJ58DRAFT_744998 [Suillus subalutaceus]KAG1857697.1 hypothetical protein DFJ58DRAFT_744998 [Suillus subalutaceus]
METLNRVTLVRVRHALSTLWQAVTSPIRHPMRFCNNIRITSLDILRRALSPLKSVLVGFLHSVWKSIPVSIRNPMHSVRSSNKLRTTPLGLLANALLTIALWARWIVVAVALSTLLLGLTHANNQGILITIVALVLAFQIFLATKQIIASYRQLLCLHVELDRFWRRSSHFRAQYPLLRAKLENSRLCLLLLHDRNLAQHVLTLLEFHYVLLQIRIISGDLPRPTLFSIIDDADPLDVGPETWEADLPI